MEPLSLSDLKNSFSGKLLTQPDDMSGFLTDWRGKWKGRALAVAQPDTTADVAGIVRWCHSRGIPLVPQGGNTGLSGGSVPDASGRALVVSLKRLNRIDAVDGMNNTVVAEAGCTLLQVQAAARDAGRLFPLSLAAEGSCTIGGNLATNAGGVHVLRYGNARDLCLGLEIVTADGEIWNGLRGLRKDNTGYDLRNLYIGSEGTLGIITKAVLKLFPQPAARVVAFVAVTTPAKALELLHHFQSRAGGRLCAFELLSDACLGLVLRHVHGARSPLNQRHPWYALVEISNEESHGGAMEVMETTLAGAFNQGTAMDAAVSTSESQLAALWGLRENISESQAAEGKNIKHDVSVPISQISNFIQSALALLESRFPALRPIVFGHLGDGNLHFNISPPAGVQSAADSEAFLALEPAINRVIHDAVAQHGGSISAEHGLGVLRRDEAARYKSEVELKLMRSIKSALDPRGLMNPGKVLGAIASDKSASAVTAP
jgi:FAD/FMN-containing dehydrogenase